MVACTVEVSEHWQNVTDAHDVTDKNACNVAISKVTYEFTVDDSGEEFGFVYVSLFRAVAKLQLHEIARSWKAKPARLVPASPV